MTEWITRLDFSVLYKIQDIFRCSFLDLIMPKLTMLGSAGFIWLVCAGVMLLKKKHRRTGALMLIGLMLGVLIGNVIMKNLFARPRPCWIDTTVSLLVAVPKDYSFPSGHTLASVISATILTCADRRFGFVAIPLAAVISLSRLYLFVHFPSDVLASVLLGIITGLIVFRFGGRLFDKAMTRRAALSKE